MDPRTTPTEQIATFKSSPGNTPHAQQAHIRVLILFFSLPLLIDIRNTFKFGNCIQVTLIQFPYSNYSAVSCCLYIGWRVYICLLRIGRVRERISHHSDCILFRCLTLHMYFLYKQSGFGSSQWTPPDTLLEDGFWSQYL